MANICLLFSSCDATAELINSCKQTIFRTYRNDSQTINIKITLNIHCVEQDSISINYIIHNRI